MHNFINRTHLKALFVFLFVAGCSDKNPSFYVQGQLIPEEEDGVCVYDVEGSLLLRGSYNIDFDAPYNLYPVLSNTAVGLTTDISADPNGVVATGASVTLLNADRTRVNTLDPVTFPNPFFISTFAFVPSSTDGVVPGRAPGGLPVIPTNYRQFLGPDRIYIIRVEMSGETLGGTGVDAAPFDWVIDTCNGACLFDCTQQLVGGDLAYPCNPGQDIPTGGLGRPICI
ncbi:MAG: hypothetical protein AAF355_09155 [Myxococcota bacterium]